MKSPSILLSEGILKFIISLEWRLAVSLYVCLKEGEKRKERKKREKMKKKGKNEKERKKL